MGSDQTGSSGKHIFNIVEYGAVGNGKTNNTKAIAKAIEACSHAGGGTVLIPAGRFLTGAVFLKSNMTFHLEPGAEILGSEDPDDYPVIESRWEGIERKTYACLINGIELVNTAITGRGTINGRGKVWWDRVWENNLEYPRPRLIGFFKCTNLLIEDVTLTNSPSWTVNPVYCENVAIHNITIINPYDSPNTDGINPDSCRNVRISGCYIDVGDDCITLKSGRTEDGRRVGKPCENITVSNCTIVHGHGGVVIGSEMAGDVRNVVISNCIFTDTDRGIRIKSRRGSGGAVEDIRVNNIIMDNVICPFVMNLYYYSSAKEPPAYLNDPDPLPVSEETPCFRNIHFSNITSKNTAGAAGFILGLPEMPIQNVTFSNIMISMSGGTDMPLDSPAMKYGLKPMKDAGFMCKNAKNISFNSVKIVGVKGTSLSIENAEDIEIYKFSATRADTDAPVIEMKQVKQAIIHGCSAAPGTRAFLELAGSDTTGIIVSGNNLMRAINAVVMDNDVSKDAVIGENR